MSHSVDRSRCWKFHQKLYKPHHCLAHLSATDAVIYTAFLVIQFAMCPEIRVLRYVGILPTNQREPIFSKLQEKCYFPKLISILFFRLLLLLPLIPIVMVIIVITNNHYHNPSICSAYFFISSPMKSSIFLHLFMFFLIIVTFIIISVAYLSLSSRK